ncbi:MAG: cation:proton antiporter [Pseudomonadota bacterium]|nr:cation:proton antiporter [Pseudomonadota bacterium]
MEHGVHIPYLVEILSFLVAAVAIIPVARRMGLSPVIGYLAAGVLVGPFGFGLIDPSGGLGSLAELGVVFLMFTIGLELSLERLWGMRRLVFGLGSAQILSTGIVVGLVALAWGNSVEASILLGACFALSSTAVVIQLLEERGELASAFGRRVVSVLLMQDIAVIPILFLVGLFGPAPEDGSVLLGLAIALGKAVLAVALIVIAGRLLLRPLFRIVASSHDAELFTALILLTILLTGVGVTFAGVPMALGAFLAGALIAETEFRHQVQADLMPFKGLLLGLFFMTVAMGIDPTAVIDRAEWLVLGALGLATIKASVAFPLYRAFGLGFGSAARAGLLIGQSGEFVFVVVGAAMSFGLIAADVGTFMILTAVLSMLMTPGLDALGRFIAARDRRTPKGAVGASDNDLGEIADHVIICGYGRVGRTVARMLDRAQAPYVAVDMDAGGVVEHRRGGAPVVFGDCRRAEVLRALGIDRASAVVVTLDQPEAADATIASVRRDWPLKPVYARARDAAHAREALAMGATEAIPENLESSLQLASRVLQGLGVPLEAANQTIELIRQLEYDSLPDPARKKDTQT